MNSLFLIQLVKWHMYKWFKTCIINEHVVPDLFSFQFIIFSHHIVNHYSAARDLPASAALVLSCHPPVDDNPSTGGRGLEHIPAVLGWEAGVTLDRFSSQTGKHSQSRPI